MKKSILIIAFICLAAFQSQAQRVIYIDSDYILNKIPEYKTAQTELDNQSKKWQDELEKMYQNISKMYQSYQAEQSILPDAVKKQREDEIIAKEQEAKDFQKQKFGYDGELVKKRQSLVKPIQDRVFDAIKKIAETKAYDFVLDKASNSRLIFSNAKYDKSDEILQSLGY